MSSLASEKRSNDGRWWEFYFVRYFVGTVVGGVIIFYLNTSVGSSLKDSLIPGLTDLKKLDAQVLSIIGALGLAYCYVASAPVLVLHATRGAFLRKNKTKYNYFIGTSLFLVLAVAGTACIYLEGTDIKSILSFALMAIVLFFQLIPFFFSIKNDGALAHDYYLKLTAARSNGSEVARQYVESYKHLREHGNAFFILIFEVALGTVLATTPTPNLAIIVLVLWIMPAAFVWGIGSLLEYRFANTSIED